MQVSLNRMRAHHLGFSLIEILVVLTIIAFATKMVVYSLEGGAEDELDTQALRLHTTINMASEFAILNQIELGLMVEENTLEFSMHIQLVLRTCFGRETGCEDAVTLSTRDMA